MPKLKNLNCNLVNNQPKITILVPMFNCEKYIKKCVVSLQQQTYSNIQIVVLDDGSTDDSYKIVQQLAQTDSRIVLKKKQNEKNLSKTRNKLLEFVNTEYFIFVDSDDYVHKDFVKILYNNLINNNADCSACSFSIINLYYPRVSGKEKVFCSNIIPNMILSNNIGFVLWNKLFKTSNLNNLKFDESSSYGEDFVFCYNYLKDCQKVVYCGRQLYKYRFRKGSTIRQEFSNNHKVFLLQLKQLLSKELDVQNQNALKAWICYTAMYYKLLLKKHKTQYKDYIIQLDKDINENKIYLKSAKQLSFVKRLSCLFLN